MNTNMFNLNVNELKKFGLNPFHWIMADVRAGSGSESAVISFQHIDDPELQIQGLAFKAKDLYRIHDLAFVI